MKKFWKLKHTHFTVMFFLLAVSLGTVTEFWVDEREEKRKRTRKKERNQEAEKYKLRVGRKTERWNCWHPLGWKWGEKKFKSMESFLFGGLERGNGDLGKIEKLGDGDREKDLTVCLKRWKATLLIIEGGSKKQDWANKRKKDEKSKAGSGVQEEKMKSKEMVTEMSQDAGYRTGEGADVWELKKSLQKIWL